MIIKIEELKDLILLEERSIANKNKDSIRKKRQKQRNKEGIAERTKIRRRKKSDEENQEGQGLKILTSDQMLGRLPIALAQLKAGNNSEKLKNEIRQLLYSFYRSKKLTKTIYNNLINTT